MHGEGAKTVCVATAWQRSQIVGELNISFNDAGDVESCSGLPHVMVADSFKRKNDEGVRVEIECTDRDAVYARINAYSKLSIVNEDAQAASVLVSF